MTSRSAQQRAATDAPITVRRNYEYRIYPTRWQAAELDRQLRLCCDLYNGALEQRRRMWRDHHTPIGFCEQSRQLTQARRELPWLASMNALAQHDVLRRLDHAYGAFFRRVAAGQTPGYPRFRPVERYESITWAQHGHGCRVDHGRRLYLQAVGNVKVRWHRSLPDQARVTQVTVRRRAGRWYAILCLELPAPAPLPPTGRHVGIDVGVTAFATLSDGEEIPGPRAARAAARALRRSQRNISRKRKGSRRRRRAVEQHARAHDKVYRQRKDHAHKTARALVERYDLIAIEDLNVTGMTSSARGTLAEPGRCVAQKSGLNRGILDAAWSQFTRLLAQKADETGRHLVTVPTAGTNQTCSRCGAHAPKPLSQRTHHCPNCHYTTGRDHNAAENIIRLAREPAWRTTTNTARSAEAHTCPQTAPARAVATHARGGQDRDDAVCGGTDHRHRVATHARGGQDRDCSAWAPKISVATDATGAQNRDRHLEDRETVLGGVAAHANRGQDQHEASCERSRSQTTARDLSRSRAPATVEPANQVEPPSGPRTPHDRTLRVQEGMQRPRTRRDPNSTGGVT